MGGNAMAHRGATRQPKAVYDRVVAEALHDLAALFPGVRAEAVRSYVDKTDFGDADILVDRDALPAGWLETLKEAWSAHDDARGPGFRCDSPVNPMFVSFERHGLQVDLITTPVAEFDMAADYYAFNDLGNLIGRLGHKIGLKIGHDGVWVVVRDPQDPTHWKTEILVTRRLPEVLELLGLDPAKHAAGFSSKEDIYRYVASSRFFDPDIYLLDNRSYRSKVRDRKRATYAGFLEWITQNQAPAHHSFRDKSERGGHGLREPYFTDVLVPAWPHLAVVVESALSDRAQQKQTRALLDPRQIAEWTGLSGRELGAVVSALRTEASVSAEEWKSDPTKLQEACVRLATAKSSGLPKP